MSDDYNPEISRRMNQLCQGMKQAQGTDEPMLLYPADQMVIALYYDESSAKLFESAQVMLKQNTMYESLFDQSFAKIQMVKGEYAKLEHGIKKLIALIETPETEQDYGMLLDTLVLFKHEFGLGSIEEGAQE